MKKLFLSSVIASIILTKAIASPIPSNSPNDWWSDVVSTVLKDGAGALSGGSRGMSLFGPEGAAIGAVGWGVVSSIFLYAQPSGSTDGPVGTTLTENPFDRLGQIHNEVIISNPKDIKSALELAKSKVDAFSKIDAATYDKISQEADAASKGIKAAINSYSDIVTFVNRESISAEQKKFILEYFKAINDSGSASAALKVSIEYTQKVKDSSFSAADKNRLFATIAITSHSVEYWVTKIKL